MSLLGLRRELLTVVAHGYLVGSRCQATRVCQVCGASSSVCAPCFLFARPNWTGLGTMLFMLVTLLQLVLEWCSTFYLEGVGLLVACPKVGGSVVISKILVDRVLRSSQSRLLSVVLHRTALWILL